MTISTTATKASAAGTGVAGQEVFFRFPVSETSDLVVFTRVTATEVETTLTENTDYTVDLTVGKVTVTAAVATTSEIHVERQTNPIQGTNLELGGSYSGLVVEAALDKLTKLAQENRNNLSGGGYETLTQSDFDQLVFYDNDLVAYDNNAVILPV